MDVGVSLYSSIDVMSSKFTRSPCNSSLSHDDDSMIPSQMRAMVPMRCVCVGTAMVDRLTCCPCGILKYLFTQKDPERAQIDATIAANFKRRFIIMIPVAKKTYCATSLLRTPIVVLPARRLTAPAAARVASRPSTPRTMDIQHAIDDSFHSQPSAPAVVSV